jgi:hypothetical protein
MKRDQDRRIVADDLVPPHTGTVWYPFMHEHDWVDITAINHRRRHYICNCGATKREPR